MKIAIFSESPADESAIYILVEALLETQIEQIPITLLTREGWTHVFKNISVVICSLYYNSDPDGLIVVVDSDSTPLHNEEHETSNVSNLKCRICQLQKRIVEVQTALKPVPNRNPLKVAIGLAVPAIEAWYLCGKDAHSTEAMLIQRQDAGTSDLRRELKRRVYKTDRPPLSFQIECAIAEANRIANDIAQLKVLFPNGFGKLARDIANW